MMAMLKAIPFGIALTLIVALFMGSGGATGGMLAIRPFDVTVAEIGLDITLYWSWMLFLIGSALSFALFLMIGD